MTPHIQTALIREVKIRWSALEQKESIDKILAIIQLFTRHPQDGWFAFVPKFSASETMAKMYIGQ